jgi:putative ABC transport system permease protein
MLKNYLVIALRKLKKHKGFAFLNIAGLAIGLAVFMLISLYIQFELSYDRFHENHSHIYWVEQILDHGTYKEPDVGCPTPLSGVLLADFPEIEDVTRVIQGGRGNLETDQDEKLRAKGIFFVDNSFLKIFSFPSVSGTQGKTLAGPYTTVITEDLAYRLFGRENPVGRVIRTYDSYDLKVTGVIKKIPVNSHLRFDMLISTATLSAENGSKTFTRWYDNWVPVYILLKPGLSFQELNEKLRYYLKTYQGERSRNELYLRPLARIHLYSHVNHENGHHPPAGPFSPA